jgi:dTDP-4-amino-4,6-dideoxygalactose transaminase
MKPTKQNPKTLALRGGESVFQGHWPAWPCFDHAERQQLLAVLESGHWWYGDKVKQFETEFAAFQRARYAVTATNGTTAIEMGLKGLSIVEGDEVIVPPYSFIATASAVLIVGAIPVFADIQPETLCLDPDDVERKITPRTKAIIPVHVAGYVADMDRLNAIARKYKLAILEDAAHSWGSLWKDKGTGTLGNCGTFSFQVSKNITCGEGGALVTNDEALADLCRSYSNCGRRKGAAWYDHDYLGSNLRMTEFQAAILLAQLGRLKTQAAKRQANAIILDRALRDLPGIRLLAPEPRMTRRSYHMYIFRVDEPALGISRDRFLDALNAEGVPASKGWHQPLYANGVFRNAKHGPAHGITAPLFGKGLDYSEVQCPATEQVCRDAVWIPHHVLLADKKDFRAVPAAIEKIVTHLTELR